VLWEEDLTSDRLLAAIFDLDRHRDQYIQAMQTSQETGAITQIVELCRQFR
jgi:hypothetical protein